MRKSFAGIMGSIMIVCTLSLTGCTTGVDLNDEQNNLVAEYAAGVLVNHSYKFQNKYAQEETTTQTPVINPSDEATTPADGETTAVQTDPTLFDCAGKLGMGGVSIHYSSYITTKEYPENEDALFTFAAEDGYELIVVSFTINNPTAADIVLNTYAGKPVFRAVINGRAQYNNYGNLLLNDISNLKDVTIKAGDNYNAVLVFMVEEQTATSINTFSVGLLEDGESTCSVKIK